tara:strand:- start:219 stop:398 length:180 start_codon:yes stop_codon:yes gene_type:complete
MSELIIAFLIIGLAFTGLSVGLILRNQPIKGSCGGMANLQDGSTCEICGTTNPNSCSKS